MNASDRPEFQAAIDGVFAAWLKPAPDARTLKAFWTALDAFEIDEITEACTMAISRGGHYAPKATDLQACAREVHRQHTTPVHAAPADHTCAACEGVGQIVTRAEPYTFAHGDRVITKTYTYAAPCPHCERGRRITHARAAKGMRSALRAEGAA